MVKCQGRSKKKLSGGRIWPKRKKRRYELGRESAETRIGDTKQIRITVRGGGHKLRLLVAAEANITLPESGRTQKAKISSVLENSANPHFVRRNIVTAGAVIETDIGNARVTGRPGQDGTVNAILLEAKNPEEKPPAKTKKKPKESKEETPSEKKSKPAAKK